MKSYQEEQMEKKAYLIIRDGRKDTIQFFRTLEEAIQMAKHWSAKYGRSAGSTHDVFVYKLEGVTSPKVPIEVMADFTPVQQPPNFFSGLKKDIEDKIKQREERENE